MPRPNIVFIITDQQRADCLSVSGHPVVETPHLDMLAAKGVNFTASYSCCPSCIAARASMFTGLRPTTHGRLGYQDCVPWRYDVTLPGELAKAGYQTHCIGKTHFFPQRAHLGFHSIESYEGAQNFDGRFVNDYWEWLRERAGSHVNETLHGADWNSWVARPSHLPEELHNNTWVVTRGIEFLRRRDPTRPFFLNLSFHRPHAPLDPPQVFWDLYKDRPLPPVPVGDWTAPFDVPINNDNAWRGRLASRLLDTARRAYYAQIAHIDSQIGRLMIALREQRAGPTWIVFTSDHGEMLGDHCLFRKTYAYEGSARTPLVICPPDAAALHASDAPATQEDLMPTMLEIAGAPIPASIEGRSLLPLMAPATAFAARRPYVHGEHAACYGDDAMGVQYLTDGRMKYVWYTVTGQEQLFDLAKDRDELHDCAADPAYREPLLLWRSRLISELAPRTRDSLSDGKRLLPGKALPHVREELLHP